MRLKKLIRASFDQVRITRQGTTAIIQFADETIGGVNLTIGEDIHGMTDRDILELHNDIISAQEQSLRDWDNTVFEIPPAKPQIKFSRDSGQWVPQGEVLRCIIHDNEHREPVFEIDGKELSLGEFGRMLVVYAGWGMRIAFVPEELVHEQPKIQVRAPRQRRRK